MFCVRYESDDCQDGEEWVEIDWLDLPKRPLPQISNQGRYRPRTGRAGNYLQSARTPAANPGTGYGAISIGGFQYGVHTIVCRAFNGAPHTCAGGHGAVLSFATIPDCRIALANGNDSIDPDRNTI